MSKKEKYFYRVGYPENYAKAYKEDDRIYFDIGQLSCGFSCGGQILKVFPSSYATTKSFDSFLNDLNAVDIITHILGEDTAKKVLDDMWKYLCDA